MSDALMDVDLWDILLPVDFIMSPPWRISEKTLGIKGLLTSHNLLPMSIRILSLTPENMDLYKLRASLDG
ncbi:uncharacterized protein N7500_003028 [Penicillium coprophilum]|uniref:uncharacterized protein n=1 Tax=Penicillium coprophilum TaxID=36646 RepID=UPI00238C104D|nr:uncharacterized protein N7500_003028 [Penicillium coprophilum]KAJ5170245.1 hypothetical protein N7500_003028 [Penicillium coprophilum]